MRETSVGLTCWSATWTQSSAHVSAAEPSWGGPLPTGGTVNVGFNAAWSGANPAPAVFTLNGTVVSLEPVYETAEQKDLFFIFKDLTSQDTT